MSAGSLALECTGLDSCAMGRPTNRAMTPVMNRAMNRAIVARFPARCVGRPGAGPVVAEGSLGVQADARPGPTRGELGRVAIGAFARVTP